MLLIIVYEMKTDKIVYQFKYNAHLKDVGNKLCEKIDKMDVIKKIYEKYKYIYMSFEEIKVKYEQLTLF